jgi:hypothetical protein
MLATSFKSPRILYYSKDFRKTNLKKLWSDRLIEILIPKTSNLSGLIVKLKHDKFPSLETERISSV